MIIVVSENNQRMLVGNSEQVIFFEFFLNRAFFMARDLPHGNDSVEGPYTAIYIYFDVLKFFFLHQILSLYTENIWAAPIRLHPYRIVTESTSTSRSGKNHTVAQHEPKPFDHDLAWVKVSVTVNRWMGTDIIIHSSSLLRSYSKIYFTFIIHTHTLTLWLTTWFMVGKNENG